MISRDEALKILRENVSDPKLIKHMLAVEAIMRELASRLGEDVELWGLVGLLHDVDYQKTMNDFSKHGLIATEILKDLLPEEALDAIKSHNEMTGFKCDSKLAKALKACDQLAGLIVATRLVMPGKTISEIKVKSLKKKFKAKDFARSVKRENIRLVEELGLTLVEFFEIGLKALRGIEDEIK